MPLIRKDAAPTVQPAGSNDAALHRLTSLSEDERFAAARALSGKAEATAALGAALQAEREPQVREAILTGLARIATAQCAEFIIPLIRSEDAEVRTGALDALRLMPDAVATHLADLLLDGDADVRLLACELARVLPTPLASRLICDLLEREDEPNVCAAALEVLTEVGEPDALPTLERLQARFADTPFLTFAIRIAMDRIGVQPGG